jgi:hypothetical protein
MAWSSNVHVGGYLRAGKRDAKWDDAVIEALEDFAFRRVYRHPPEGRAPTLFHDRLRQAVDAGCNDPFVCYLYARQFAKPPERATLPVAGEYGAWAGAMEAADYPEVLKFFVSLRAAQAYRAAATNQLPEVNQLRKQAGQHLQRVLEKEEIPAHAAYDACLEFYRVISRNPKFRAQFQTVTDGVLTKRWSNEGFPYALKGQFYVNYAWDARGSDWADTVTPEGWRLFRERLEVAEAALTKAWELDPTLSEVPLSFMRLELGQGRGRARLEQWFERAIAFPDKRYDAVHAKLWYLEPRWHGTENECLEAARAVLKSDLFQGQTPLQLYHLHESLAQYYGKRRPDYWREPHVWPDLKAAFDRYFELNGDDTDWRHNFVMCAWRCEQWRVLEAEIPKLKWVNHAYFGGREAFDQMKAKAREMAGGGAK